MKKRRWSKASLTKKVISTIFGGCPGCIYEDKDHIVSMSFVHTNNEPTTPRPTPIPSAGSLLREDKKVK